MFEHYIKTNDARGLKKSLEEGGFTQEDLNEGLILSTSECEVDVVKTFLEFGANINATHELYLPPLHHAIDHLNKKVAHFLIDMDADINQKSFGLWTPLHHAINSECDYANQIDTEAPELDLITTLLNNGAKVDSQDCDGKTALDLAKEYQHLEVIQLLEKQLRTSGST